MCRSVSPDRGSLPAGSARVGPAFFKVLALARQFTPLPCKLRKVGAHLVASFVATGHCGHVFAIPSARKIVLYLGTHAERLSPTRPRQQTRRGPTFSLCVRPREPTPHAHGCSARASSLPERSAAAPPRLPDFVTHRIARLVRVAGCGHARATTSKRTPAGFTENRSSRDRRHNPRRRASRLTCVKHLTHPRRRNGPTDGENDAQN